MRSIRIGSPASTAAESLSSSALTKAALQPLLGDTGTLSTKGRQTKKASRWWGSGLVFCAGIICQRILEVAACCGSFSTLASAAVLQFAFVGCSSQYLRVRCASQTDIHLQSGRYPCVVEPPDDQATRNQSRFSFGMVCRSHSRVPQHQTWSYCRVILLPPSFLHNKQFLGNESLLETRNMPANNWTPVKMTHLWDIVRDWLQQHRNIIAWLQRYMFGLETRVTSVNPLDSGISDYTIWLLHILKEMGFISGIYLLCHPTACIPHVFPV